MGYSEMALTADEGFRIFREPRLPHFPWKPSCYNYSESFPGVRRFNQLASKDDT
jgi:hypothetical protein